MAMVRMSIRMETALAAPKSPEPTPELVDVGAEQVGLVGHAAGVLQQLDLGEHAQVPDQLQQQHDREHRGDQRQDDVPEALHAGGAVDGCAASSTSLGDLGQARVDAQRHERHGHPDDDDQRDDEEGERLGEPVVALGRRTRSGSAASSARRGASRPARSRRSWPRRRAWPRPAAWRSAGRAGRTVPTRFMRIARRKPMTTVDAGGEQAEEQGTAQDDPEIRVGQQGRVVVEPDEFGRCAELLLQPELLEAGVRPASPRGIPGPRPG